MPNTVHVVGATSKILTFRAINQSDGSPYTSGAYNTATISASYCKDGSTPTAITLVTMTQGTWVSSGFVHRHKGLYELGAPNAAFSTTVDGVTFTIDGISGVTWEVVRVELTGVDPRSATAPDVNFASASTDALSAAGISAAAAAKIADAILARNAAGGANSAPTVSTLLLASDLKFSISGATLTVYAHDGTTVLFTRTLTRATLDAITAAS